MTRPGTAGPARFGTSVKLRGDLAAVGAIGFNAAYLFSDDGGAWNEQAEFMASGRVGVEQFGYSVSIGTDKVVVGAPHEDCHFWVAVWSGMGGV